MSAPTHLPSTETVHGLTAFLRRRFSRGARYGLGLTLAVVFTFGSLAIFVEMEDAFTDAGGIAAADYAVMNVMEQVVTDEMTPWIVGLTDTGGTVGLTILVVIIAIGLIVFRRRWEALQLVLASGLGGLVNLGLKHTFVRPRPAEQVIQATGYSFPSGHAFAAMVFYGTLLTIVWQITDKTVWRVLAAIICPLMILALGASRLYLNVHYLTDVVGGYASGFVWLVAVYLVVDGVEHHRKRREQAISNAVQGTVDDKATA